MDAQLQDQLGQTIKVATPTTAINNYGEMSYAVATTMAARIVGEQTKLHDAAGQELMSSHKLITASAIGINDRVWLPGDSTSEQGRVVAHVAERVDENGNTDYHKTWLSGNVRAR